MAKREQTESTDKKKRAEVPAVDYLDILGQCEKVAKVQSLALSDEDRLDTGLLCLNGILGGGITAGMYTFFGPEQSAKTTGAITLAGASVNQDVGLRMLWDAENSTGSSTDYVENIFKMQRVKADVETLFGVKKDGKYIIKPLVYYRDEGEAETFFNFMSALLRRLPLKRFEDNQWWLIYPKDKEHLARFGEQMDQRMSKLNDAIYLPAKSGALQAIVIIDSYPGLVPESMDEDDPNNSIAQAARELSKGITRIKGKLRSRRVALVGINQLRTNPMARFSNPEYEPGGGAIKFFCFSGDTLLMTEQGLLTAEEAYHSKPKFFQGEAGQEKPTLYDKQGYSQLMTLHTSRGHQMTGKPGHHVKVMNPLTMQAEFKSLSSLRSTAWHAGDYVGVKVGGGPTENSFVKLDYVDYTNTKFNSEHEKLIFPTKMSNALAWLMGVLVGDGHARGNTVYLACTNKGVATQFVELVDRIFGVRASVSKKGAWVCSTALVSFLTYIGAGSKSSWQKEVPWAVRLSGKSCWLAFLAGLFDADFSCGSTTVSYLAVSSTLVNQVRVMALLLGFPIANGNSKEAWWAHGANARLEADGKHRTEKQVVKKHRLKCPSIVWYGQTARDLVLSLTPYSANTERMERLAEQGREDLTPVWRILPVQKFDEDSKAQGNSIRKALKLYQEITGKSLYRMDCWDDSWIEEALSQVPSRYRTSHEREKVTLGLRSLQEILQYSKKNSIIWDKVDTVTPSKGRGMTYDGNMPHTHTIVTSGVVSHNSDVRLRFFPRALSGVPFHPKGEGQFEKEPGINGGVDTYRYINVRAIKNKLSLPNRETWLRIWVEDQHGQAQGYDPVWDVFYALHLSGQVEGKRSALRLKPHGREPFKKTLTWLQFKQAVIGSKEQKKEVFEYLGMSKAVDLRSFLLGQMRKGVYEGLYVEAQQTNKKAEADDE